MLSPHSEPTAEQARLLHLALQGILDAVKEGGDLGAPSGVLYSAIDTSSNGRVSLAQFQQIMSALVRLGKVRQKGDLYFWLADL
jgi:hypothetical protein